MFLIKMLTQCVINRENNLKCKNIMEFRDRNAYILKLYPDILQEVWETGQSRITLPMNTLVDLRVITNVRINITHITGCLKISTLLGRWMFLPVVFGFCVS
jgi:hypothetical protein